MLTKRTFFQHFQETAHDRGVLRGNVALAIDAGMKIEEVENGCLHCVDKSLTVESVLRVFDAEFQLLEVTATDNLLFGREMHDGIKKKSQLPFHTVIALRCA